MKPTIFRLYPSTARTCVTPNMATFSFWSRWSSSPKCNLCVVKCLLAYSKGATRCRDAATLLWLTYTPHELRRPCSVRLPYTCPNLFTRSDTRRSSSGEQTPQQRWIHLLVQKRPMLLTKNPWSILVILRNRPEISL